MCGIFGIVTGRRSTLPSALLKSAVHHLFRLSESRGREASGVALRAADAIWVYKQPIPASSLIRRREYHALLDRGLGTGTRGDREVAAIGHSRLVTQGGQHDNRNNQPVVSSGLVGVHNGIITNDAALWRQFPSLDRQGEVDTEVLLALLRHFSRETGSWLGAVSAAFRRVEGTASLAVLFRDFPYLLLATNNGSLYLCPARTEDALVFASERHILASLLRKREMRRHFDPDRIRQVRPEFGYLLDLADLRPVEISLDREPGGAPVLFSAGGIHEIVDLSPGPRGAPVPRENGSAGPPLLSGLPVKEFERNASRAGQLRRCTKCLLPETMPFITFGEQGVCNYCRHYRKYELKGMEELERTLAPYRGKPGVPDCIVSFSGGRDSSYGLHLAKTVLGMNPIAYTYDWGMITDLARRNQARVCGKLGIEHILVSADIRGKRENIRKNVTAWLRKPALGMVPLFMAGDKPYFYYAHKVSRQTGCRLIILCENVLELTRFKFGFAGSPPGFEERNAYAIKFSGKLRMAAYYLRQFILNPGYLNSSLWDTAGGYLCYFALPHHYLNVYQYLPWEEAAVEEVLRKEYRWETAEDTRSTWRIGDGTATFYNYIYYTLAGFTENDTFRSNQIREGVLSREKAWELTQEDNRPRYESIKWYCDTIGIDFLSTLRLIHAAPKVYDHEF